MAFIKNIIQTISQSVGFEKTTSQVNNLSNATASVGKVSEVSARSQTRLGQASASAGRSFAAQSAGLGGLVGAYAGAAATMFALQQGYAALSTAAKSETVIQGTKTLAAQVAQSGPRILKNIQDLTQGQLTLTEAATAANTALSAGFDSKQISQFTVVALKASRALGRDFTDAMSRITKGVSKLEPELLDELGIFTRIDPAVQKYAKSLGVSAKSLNEFQRRQAFANAAIDEGMRKFSSIDTTSASSQKSLEQLKVQLSELSIEFTKILVSGLTPFVNFFNGDIGNSLLLFGSIIGLVFKKAFTEIGGFVTGSLGSLEKLSAKLADKNAFDPAVLRNLSTTLKNPLLGAKDPLDPTKYKPDTGGLSGMRTKPYAKQDPAQYKEFKVALQAQIDGEVRTQSALRDTTLAYERQATVMREVLGTRAAHSVALKNLDAAIARNNAAINNSSNSAKRYIAVADKIRSTTNFIAAGFDVLAKSMNVVFLVMGAAQLIGDVFGVDMLGGIKAFFSNFSQLQANFETGLKGMVTSAAGGSDKLISDLKRLGASADVLENIPTKMIDIQKNIDSNILSMQTMQNQAATSNPLMNMLGLGPQINISPLDDYKRQVEILKQIANQKAIISQTGSSIDEKNTARQEIVLLESYSKALKLYGTENLATFGQIAESTGMAGEVIAKVFSGNSIGAITKSTTELTLYGIAIQKVGDSYDYSGLTEKQKELVEGMVLSDNAMNNMVDSAMRGAISQQALGASIVGMQEHIAALSVEYANNTNAMRNNGNYTAAQLAANAQMRAALQDRSATLKTLIELEKQLKDVASVDSGMTKAFGKDMGTFDTAVYEGIISMNGKIAASEEQQKQNQSELLMFSVQRLAKSAELAGDEVALNAYFKAQNTSAEDQIIIKGKINDEAALHARLMDAIVGKYIEAVSAAQALTKELRSKTKEAVRELNKILSDNKVLTIELRIDEASTKAKIEEQMRNLDIAQLQADINLIDAKKDNKSIKPVDAANQTYAKEKEIHALQLQAIDAKYASEKSIIAEQKALQVAKFTSEFNALQAKSAADIAAINAQLSAQRAQAQIFLGAATSMVAAGGNMADNILDAINKGAAAIHGSIVAAFTFGGVVQGVAGARAAPVFAELTAAQAAVDVAGAEAIATVTATTTAQQNAMLASHNTIMNNLSAEDKALDDRHVKEVSIANTEGQILDEKQKKRLQDAEKEGKKGSDKAAKEAEKQEELRKKLSEKLRDFNKAFTEAVTQALSASIEFIKGIVTSMQEAKIAQMKLEEDTQTASLALTTERLNKAQEDYKSSLEQEVSLREELIQKTDVLADSQKEYLSTIGKQNVSVADTSADYVTKLLDQKKTILSLDTATRKSIALGKESKTLQERELDQQSSLTQLTEERIAAEEKLTKTNELFSAALETINVKSNSLIGSLRNLAQAMAAAQEVAGIVPAGSSAGQVVTSIFGDFQGSIDDFKDIMKDFKPIGKAMVAKNSSGVQTAAIDTSVFNKLSTTLDVLGGALQGFNIGGSIAAIIGDEGYATKIGGAIGGALGTYFAPALSNMLAPILSKALSSVVSVGSTLLTTALGAAIPVVGSIIGALIGGLFKKTPRASASGTFQNGEYTLDNTSAKGGAKTSTAESIGSIGGVVLGQLVGQLESMGIAMNEVIKTYVYLKKDSFKEASLGFQGGNSISGSEFGKGQDGAQAVAEFYSDAFFKNLRVIKDSKGAITFRSLVVDSLVPNAVELQSALDNFAQKSIGEKTQDSFNTAIKFASEFNSKIIQLRGSGNTLSEMFKTIDDSANAGASSTLSYYREFLKDTKTTFGEASAQYSQATKAVKENALAQLGLTSTYNNQIVAISDATNNNDIGRITIRDIVSQAKSMEKVLVNIGYSTWETASIVAKSIHTQLYKVVASVGESLTSSINLLVNPATAAVDSIKNIVTNGSARLDQIIGQYDQIVASSYAASVDPATAAQALKNIEDAKKLTSLELSTYIKSLTNAELEAISSSSLLDKATKDLIADQLALTKAMQQQRAFKEIVDFTMDFNKQLNELTGKSKALIIVDELGNKLVGAAEDALTIADDLERANGVDAFTRTFQSMLAHISTGSNVSSNFSKAITLLNSEYQNGTKDSLNYAKALNKLGSETTEYLDYLKELQDQYESNISAISEALEAARSTLTDTLSKLETSINDAANKMSSSANTIVTTYDSLTKSIADSSNSLLDLQDKATQSYKDAKDALTDFDKSHNLSGKSSAQLAEELSNVQAQISNLVSNPMDVTDFLNVAQLNNERTKLQNEISTLTKLEEDRKKLVDSVDTALSDSDYINNLISTTAGLNDTRGTETQLVKDANAALLTFNESTTSLAGITSALTASNFDLVSARAAEETSITKVTNALKDFNSAQSQAASIFKDMSGDTGFVARAENAARSNAIEYYNSLAGSDKVAALASAGITDYTTIQDGIAKAAAQAALKAKEAASSMQSISQVFMAGGSIDWSSLPSDISEAISTLTTVFTPSKTSNLVDFSKALTEVANITTNILTTPQLINNLSSYNEGLQTNEEKVKALTSEFTTLNSTLTYLTGTNGTIESVKASIVSLASYIQKAWEDVKFNTGVAITGNLQVTASIPSSGTLSSSDSNNLATIAGKSGKFPKFKELTPEGSVVQFAKGGIVQGAGSGTSDSISARLSNGEFVVKAASVAQLGVKALDYLNSNGALPTNAAHFTMEELPTTKNGMPPVVNITAPKQETAKTDSETPVNIQVNVIDKTSGQPVSSSATISKVQGQHVVDVILEDLRNNGPIKQQLKRG